MLQNALNTYFSLCGTGGQILGIFFGAIFLASVVALTIVGMYIFFKAFFTETR